MGPVCMSELKIAPSKHLGERQERLPRRYPAGPAAGPFRPRRSIAADIATTIAATVFRNRLGASLLPAIRSCPRLTETNN